MLWAKFEILTHSNAHLPSFGIKCAREEGAQHLAKAMREKYVFEAGMKAEQRIGARLGWGYKKRELTASAEGYA